MAPVRRLYEELLEGSETSGNTSAITTEMELVSIGELEEGLLLEMSDGFWEAPARDRIRAAAQIVYTMANLEDGKRVRFLRGAIPGSISLPGGRRTARPVVRDDFNALRPWIEVEQPVAGAVVGSSLPIALELRGEPPVTVTVIVGDGELASQTLRKDRGTIEIPPIDNQIRGIVRITLNKHSVDVPVVFAATSG